MVLGKKGGLRSAVKQAGRQATKYAFTITSPSVSGLPERMESSGMILQFARGPKIAATAEADVPAERGPEGKLAWQVAKEELLKNQKKATSASQKRARAMRAAEDAKASARFDRPRCVRTTRSIA